MKRVWPIFLALLVLVIMNLSPQEGRAQNFAWAGKMGGGGYDAGTDLAVDRLNNVYIAGSFQNTADFDPGPETHKLTAVVGSRSRQDIFVVKLDKDRSFVWARRLGGAAEDEVAGMSIDGSANVYVVSAPLPRTGGTFFIAKLNKHGRSIWKGRVLGNAVALDLAADPAGNVYVTGAVNDEADFDLGPGNFTVSCADRTCAFVAKWNTDGELLWVVRIEMSGFFAYSDGRSISVDAVGNVYTTGGFFADADFDPSQGAYILSTDGSTDTFVWKLSSAGEFVWAKQIQGGDDEGMPRSESMAVGETGNAYMTGSFSGTVDFDPGPDTFELRAIDGQVFVAKLDADGNFGWARQLGGATVSSQPGIALDKAENVYTTGAFIGVGDFDPGSATFNLKAAGAYDVFVSKLNKDGLFRWARRMGGPENDIGYGIAVRSRNVHTTGEFFGRADFDPGTGVRQLTAVNGAAFVSKLTQPVPASSRQSVTRAD
jgi:hypothetical protein